MAEDHIVGELEKKKDLLASISQTYRRLRYSSALDTPTFYHLFVLVLALHGTLLFAFLIGYWLFGLNSSIQPQNDLLKVLDIRLILIGFAAKLWLDVQLFRKWRLAKRFESLAQVTQGKVLDRWKHTIRYEEGCLYRFYLAFQVGERALVRQEVDGQTFEHLQNGDVVNVLHLPGNRHIAKLI